MKKYLLHQREDVIEESAMCDSMKKLEMLDMKSLIDARARRLGVSYYDRPITMVKYMHVKYVDVMTSRCNFGLKPMYL